MYRQAEGDGDAADWRNPAHTSGTIGGWLRGTRCCRARIRGFHVAVAQGKAIVEPDPVTDNFTREAVILVALGIGWRSHAWLPILVLNWAWSGHHLGNDVMVEEGESTS